MKKFLLIALVTFLAITSTIATPQEKNPVNCIIKCVRKHLNVWTAAKLIGKCKTDRNCYLNSLKGKAKDCAMGCIGKVNNEDNNEEAKMVLKQLVEADTTNEKSRAKCIGRCLRSHLNWRTAAKLLAKCKISKSCYLKELSGKALDCVLGCFNKNEKVQVVAAVKQLNDEVSPEAKNTVKCIVKCVRKHLNVWTAARLIGKCKTDRKCYLNSLKGKAKECALGCLQGASVENVEDRKKCPKFVMAVRKKFRELETREEKKAMVKKAFEKLTEKYPNVEKKKVFRFLRLFFSRTCPVRVCKVYKRVFKGESEEDKEIDEIVASSAVEKNPVSCIVKCVRKHLSVWAAARLIDKCKTDRKCYLNALKGKAKECAMGCL